MNISKINYLLVYLVAFLLGLSFWRTPLYDPDLAFHLLGGRWVDTYHAVPRRDFINFYNVTWIDYHWFGQWLLYKLYQKLGWGWLQASTGFILASLALIIVSLIRSFLRSASVLFVLAYSSLIVFSLFGLFSARPTSIAKVLVAAALLTLVSKLKSHSKLLIIFILTILTANIHVYWVLIPGLWAALILSKRYFTFLHRAKSARRVGIRYAWGGFALLVFAGALSPYGLFTSESGVQAILTNYFVFLDVATNPKDLKPIIDELRNGFAEKSLFFWYALFSLVVSAKYYTLARLAARLPYFMLYVATLLMSIESIKYAALFIILSIPFLAPAYYSFYSQVRRLFKFHNSSFSSIGMILVALFAASYFALKTAPFRKENIKIAIEDLHLMQPISACHFLTKYFTENDRIYKIATSYDMGGWCAWAMHQERFPSNFRVTMDGRTQSVPAEEIIDVQDMYRAGKKWRETLNRLSPDAIVVRRDQALAQLLRSSESWRLEYSDYNYAVFIRLT